MALQIIPFDMQSRFGVPVHHRLWTRESASEKLLVMLPGKGYTGDYPLLYYLRSLAWQQGFDVLSVHYGLAVAMELTPENIGYLQDDIAQAIAPAAARSYSQVCVAGKSLGTIFAGETARSFSQAEVSLLLLTPIGGALQSLEDRRTLAVIGTADAQYSPELVAAYDSSSYVRWQVFEGLDHALEVKNDWRASLSVLPKIMAACEAFLREHV